MPAVTREITIDAEIGEIAAFVGHVPHLPAWTTFFKEVGEETDGRYAVTSIMGSIHTWMLQEEHAGGLLISLCSAIRETEERATVQLTEVPDGGVRVAFTVTLPDGLPSAVVDDQHAEQEQELATLKRLVETERAPI
jgi:hypothetical protein